MSGQPTVLRLPPYVAIVGAAITVLAAAILAMAWWAACGLAQTASFPG